MKNPARYSRIENRRMTWPSERWILTITTKNAMRKTEEIGEPLER